MPDAASRYCRLHPSHVPHSSSPPASCSSALLLCLLALFSAAAAENSLLPFLPLLPVPTDRQPRQGDGVGGEGYTILPVLRNEQPATVIILHGMGSTGEAWGFLSLALSFFSLNYVKFIIPTAPLTHVTYLDKQLRSWYDIRTFRQSAAANLSSLTPAQLLNLVDIDRPQFDNAVERVNDIIRSEVERGVNPQRILLLGFSQGGALALHAFLRSPWSLAAVIGVATWIPFIQEYPSAMSPATRNRHMLLMHGTDDTAVPYVFAQYLANRLSSFRSNVNFTTFAGEPHVILNVQVIETIEHFVSQRAPGTMRYLDKLINDMTEKFGSLSSRLESVPNVSM
ncbi:Acyl-protein thioesterase 1 [Gracilariopsis chorda]|uniref:Acyl-protein thioesterase 1 n=1 Tax=Gracilariopsis chorda TaxID=448386 RepID=A0A2V3J8N1_9FLOR|nr:Acyl-protein thioesterase 1 [Gracilariopsis chorda]|eukprot:PXF50067.1 Acyl-protein thioesterase 1 [Gracilariopsis chorda]